MNHLDLKMHKKTIHISILIFFSISIFIITLSTNVKAQNIFANSKQNMFYVKVINYTIPMIKINSLDVEKLDENSFSLKGKFLSFAGIDLKRPSSILSKEIASTNNLEYTGNESASNLNSFKLDEKEISRGSIEDKTSNVYDPNLKKTLNSSKPEVFIYHSHTTESYDQKTTDSTDESKNVCMVGDVLQNELEKNYGISVIHDKTVHNAYSYNKSYSRSGETVDKFLKQYGDFKLVIDIHRDSAENKNSVTTQINGENAAKIMFVMARKNPHFQKNMEAVNKLVAISNKLYPGFCKGICYYDYGTGYFNQNKSNNAMLIEVGANINTVDEVKVSSKYLARIIGEYINGKK